MNSPDFQQAFFNRIRESLPSHVSMPDELADLLNISYDSVYRRIRGEKPISMNELKLLCEHFQISLDQVLDIKSEAVLFQAPDINQPSPDFASYLQGILKQFGYFNSFKTRKLSYLCKDLPIWYFYIFPEIAAFKTFCWIKTVQSHKEYVNKKFSLKEFSFDECFRTGQQILKEYNRIACVELWNYESLSSTFRQIEYYKDAGLFADKDDFNKVIDSLRLTIQHLQKQAEVGGKFLPDLPAAVSPEPYELFINEVILGNNTIMLELDSTRHCFINYNVLSYLFTKDDRFTTQAITSFRNLLSRSSNISGTGERFRNKYFEYQYDRLELLRR
ncbi:MAG TPA: helix-turn-helix domain-containing protein [Flavitalea sp.]|nr:helix-turn-helix domain-containing protein [Flavitalea sp.]